MGAINDFNSEMRAISKISEISIKAVEASRRGLPGKGVTAAALAGALALSMVIQDVHAMNNLAPESMISETIMNISRTFECEGLENSQITLAALDGMSTCVAAFGNHAGIVDVGPEFADYRTRISESSEPSSNLSEDVLESIQGYANTAWSAVTENGPFKSIIEAIAAFSALVEAVKYIRDVIEKTMGRARQAERERTQDRSVRGRREPEADDAANDTDITSTANNARIEPVVDIDTILGTDVQDAANDDDDYGMEP